MGYTTYFDDEFKLDKTATIELINTLRGLATTRRVKRKVDETKYGVEGEFYFKEDGYFMKETNIIDHNQPPRTQPGLHCQWELQEDLQTIKWDGNEKFYNYIEWIFYIIESVLKPAGYTLNGTVTWAGEDSDDFGRMEVKDNVLYVSEGKTNYGPATKVTGMEEKDFGFYKELVAVGEKDA